MLLLFLYGFYRSKRRAELPVAGHSKPATRVSILLPVRNEEENIARILHCLSEQDYPEELFEILIIDDHSEDQTCSLAEANKRSNVKLIRLMEGSGKKTAITEGVKRAAGTLIITTDADCTMGKQWVSSLVAEYESCTPKMIVAPVLLSSGKGFLQSVQSQEMTVLSACACAALYYGVPVLCSGANLAYEKQAFISVSGFDGFDQTATGDDMFLMLKIRNRFPGAVRFLLAKDAVVVTRPEATSASALSQRKRWASKTFSYGFSLATGVAVLIFLMNLLIVVSGILCAINVKFAYALVTCFSAKVLVDFMLLRSASLFYGKKLDLPVFAAASVLYPVYVTLIGLTAPFTNYSWKGRKS